MSQPTFQSPEAYAQFNKVFARFVKSLDAKQLAQLQAVMKEGRDLVGWKAVGRKVLEA